MTASSPHIPSILYHVTHYLNTGAILRRGLLLEMAEGASRVWLCEEDKLEWATQHVSSSHRWYPGDCVVMAVDTAWLTARLIRRREGVYYTVGDVPARAMVALAIGREVYARSL